jgi:5-methylcytosine-specific restriction protein A
MPHKAPSHRPARPPARDPRPSAASRGYGASWRKLRPLVLARDPLCRDCGRLPSLHVDHVVARERGGSDALANLQGLCHACHSRKTVRADGGLGHRPKGVYAPLHDPEGD